MREPQFTVSSVQQRKIRESNAYVDFADQTLWRVVLRNDYVEDNFMELFFETEFEARSVRKGPIQTAELFGLLQPYSTAFRVKDVRQERVATGTNPFTGMVQWAEAWRVLFEAITGTLKFANLWFLDEQEARLFKPDGVYGPLDFLKNARILITFYPEEDYVAGRQTEGYFDGQGYHKPAVYPAGHYGAGFFTGEFIPLVPTARLRSFGQAGYLLYTFSGGFVVRTLDGETKVIKY